ncbi:hypothetical protein ACLMJK_008745 [Lecanora helva]
MSVQTQRTRFVCVSDTHNASPADGAFKLPKGDVLIHAGDLTKQGTYAELRKTLDWIDKADFEAKLVVAGNHDITFDEEFYAQYGQYFHNQCPQDPQACIALLKEYPSITYLNHESVNIKLTRENGPRASFRVFGSPWSPANGLWAFGYSRDKASQLWESSIPLDTDIVIAHTPPKYHCDESSDHGAAGCEVLRQKLWRVRPSLVVCGHIHEGRGAERVIWDLETPNVKYKELMTGYWTDEGAQSKKQSLIDLSLRSSAPLNNTGDRGKALASKSLASLPWAFKECSYPSFAHPDGSPSAVIGQGGTPPSGRCDMEALNGRLGRQETCIVNAAIMASSWPYKAKTNNRYNKPIVVDIDLPVQPAEEEIVARPQPDTSDQSLGSTDTTASSQETFASLSS